MKKIAALIILITILMFPMSLIKRYRIDVMQNKMDDHVELKHGNKISQKFISQHNNLSTIRVTDIINPLVNGKAANQEKFRFSLIDEEIGEVVRQLDFVGANVGTSNSLQMRFDPIPESKRRKYIFEIQSVTIPNPGLNITGIMIGFSRLKGDISFQTFYKDTIIKLIYDSFLDFNSRLLGDKLFIGFYCTLLVLMLVAIYRYHE